MRLLIFLGFTAVTLAFASDNTLTPEEQKAGWKLLFDGRTMNGWLDPATKNQPGDAWMVENGCLKTRLKPRIEEDLVSEESYGDFELKFDWRISPGANTGVKYRLQHFIFVDETRIQKGPGGFEGMLGRELANPRSDRATMAPDAHGFVYPVGFEFQLIDDQRHPDARRDPRHITGALYSMMAPKTSTARPAGEWNQSLLVVKGNHFEHWVNGVKVLEGSLDSKEVRDGASQRWRAAPAIGKMLTEPKPVAPISLQHHGDEVWFRNLEIHRLD